MLGRDEGSKFLHRLCRHYFFCEIVPVRNSSGEEAVSVGVCFCTAQGEAALLFLANLLMTLLEVKSDLLVVLICLLFRTGVRKDSAGMAGMRPAAISLYVCLVEMTGSGPSASLLCYGARLAEPVLFNKTGGAALNIFQLVDVLLLVWIPDHSAVFKNRPD